jgi:multimeric flavodoxin WrbA
MVLVIKGSVNMEKGTTALLLGAFLEGMKIAGTSLELYYSGLFTLSLFF